MKLLLAAALVMAASPALACSCRKPDASTPPPPYLVVAQVLNSTVSADGQNVVTKLRVARAHIGKPGRIVLLHSRVSSAACGITFEVGQRQLFAFSRQGKRYVTNLCQMLHARL